MKAADNVNLLDKIQSDALYIDYGNSQLKAFFQGELFTGEIQKFQQWLAKLVISTKPTKPICYIACVNKNTQQLETVLQPYIHKYIYFVSQPIWHNENTPPLYNGYENSTTLGIDRWCALISAWFLYPKMNITVISLGTATTIDFIQDTGQYIGGLIAPGLQTSLHALQNKTNLPTIQIQEIHNSKNNITSATNTIQAMINGALGMQADWITRRINAYKKQHLLTKNKVIIYGGNADILSQHISVEYLVLQNIVLFGTYLLSRS